MLKEKIAQVKELKCLRKEYDVKNREVFSLISKASISDVRHNMELPNRLNAPAWGTANFPCKVIQTGDRTIFMLCALADSMEGYVYEFHCPDFNEDAPCTKCDCMHNVANHNHFAFEKANAELIDLSLKIKAAKKRVWGREK